MNTTQSMTKMKIPGMGTKTLKEMKESKVSRSKNSKRVTIFRWNSIMETAQNADGAVKEYMASGIKSIGSFWEGQGSKRKGTGLTDAEILILLPALVTVPANDREFWAKVELFYTEYNLKIPFANGHTLEIGLSKSNEEEISADNMPLNIHDYVSFRHAIAHPQVALSKEEAIGNRNKVFWIYDPESISLNEKESIDLKDRANVIYNRLKENGPRRQMMLTLLGFDLRTFEKEINPAVAQTKALRDTAEKDPLHFLNTYQNKNFDSLFWIRLGISYGILRTAGNYIMTKDGDQIAQSEEEACRWWADKNNSSVVSMLKGSIQSASKFIPVSTQGQEEEEPNKE